MAHLSSWRKTAEGALVSLNGIAVLLLCIQVNLLTIVFLLARIVDKL